MIKTHSESESHVLQFFLPFPNQTVLLLINKIPAIPATILNPTIMHLSMEPLLTIITLRHQIIHRLVHTIIDRMGDTVSRNKSFQFIWMYI